MTDEILLDRTKKRLVALKKTKCPSLKELAIKNLAVNLSYFINKPGIKQQLAILGPDLRQEILDELSKLSCSAERNTGDSKMMDLLINILPHLLSSETKEFQTKWILTFCSPEQRNPYRNFILNIVADCAPNLCFLIVEGEMFPEEIKMPTVDAITRMKCLTRLSAGNLIFQYADLMEMCKSLRLLECLRVKIKFDNIITATVNKKELRENLRCLKDFRFSILPSLQIWDASSSAMLPIYSSLLFGKICAETLPNLEVMKLISKNSDKNLFLFEETQFEFQSSLRHLAVCLYDRYANNQLEQFWMLPEVTNLTVNFTNFTTNSLEESSPMFQLTKVTDLRLEGIDSEEILLCFLRKFGGNLRTLYVEVSSILVDELRLSFAQISKLCPKLEKLELKGHIDMIDSSEHFLPFENLQELQWEVSKENAIASILQSPNLKKVSLMGVSFSVASIERVTTIVNTNRNGQFLRHLAEFKFSCSLDIHNIHVFHAVSSLVKTFSAFLPKLENVFLGVTLDGLVESSMARQSDIFIKFGDFSLINFLTAYKAQVIKNN